MMCVSDCLWTVLARGRARPEPQRSHGRGGRGTSPSVSDAAATRKSSVPGQPAGCEVGYRGVYSPRSIAAMPPVSLVGLNWAMDRSDA
jgi:hypothetical protein